MKFKAITFLAAICLLFCSCSLNNKIVAIENSNGQKSDFIVELLPNPNIIPVHPNETIAFRILPISNKQANGRYLIDFGDGNQSEIFEINCPNGRCKGITLVHSYDKPGNYHPNLLVPNQTSIPKESISKILICENFRSDQDIIEDVILDISKQTTEGILVAIEDYKDHSEYSTHSARNTPKVDKPKFVIVGGEDANFAYPIDSAGKKNYFLSKRISEKLKSIEMQPNNPVFEFEILDRTPQILIRLAHEAVGQEKKSYHS